METIFLPAAPLLILSCFGVAQVVADSLTAPVNVTIRELQANSGLVTWDIPEGDPVIGFAITQQKKDVRMLRFIQEVNTTTQSCALWDLDQGTDYIVHVQSIGTNGPSPPSLPLLFRTPTAAETANSEDEVTMEEVGQVPPMRAGEIIIIVVVLIMWAGVIALFCRQYDIIKDNEPSNNKDKAKTSSECSTPEHPSGGLLRSKQHKQCDAETTPVSLRTFMDVCALPPHPSSPKTTTSTTTTTGRHLCTSLRCDVPHPSTKGLQRSLPNSDRMALLPTQTLVLMCQAFWELALPRVWT